MVPILHVYGPEVPGGDVWIRGNSEGLLLLERALWLARTTGGVPCEMMHTADGQESPVHVMRDNSAADSPSWTRSELPYSVAHDRRPGVIGPWIEAGLSGSRQEGDSGD